MKIAFWLSKLIRLYSNIFDMLDVDDAIHPDQVVLESPSTSSFSSFFDIVVAKSFGLDSKISLEVPRVVALIPYEFLKSSNSRKPMF